jgi:hypothetical protein
VAELHDNFMAVRKTAKLLHARHHSSVLLKVDIAKAFDTVGWSFLLDILAHRGCSRRTYWVLVLLSTATTRIVLTGITDGHICHTCGLWQGDLLSPLLFVLSMKALNGLFSAADSFGLFTSLDIVVLTIATT